MHVLHLSTYLCHIKLFLKVQFKHLWKRLLIPKSPGSKPMKFLYHEQQLELCNKIRSIRVHRHFLEPLQNVTQVEDRCSLALVSLAFAPL